MEGIRGTRHHELSTARRWAGRTILLEEMKTEKKITGGHCLQTNGTKNRLGGQRFLQVIQYFQETKGRRRRRGTEGLIPWHQHREEIYCALIKPSAETSQRRPSDEGGKRNAAEGTFVTKKK